MNDTAGPATQKACVDAWLASCGAVPPSRLPALFSRAIEAVWRRAQPTLGEPTTAAILERVLFDAAASSELVAALALRPTLASIGSLRAAALDPADAARFQQAFRALLVDLLGVLDQLTAHILTPGVVAALGAVRDEPLPAPTDDEGPS
ncbi:MAG TPA: hypothetical protein VHB21_19470 [Minicystis sp.]|nr:hypothetical protein [Minicystis sp.]